MPLSRFIDKVAKNLRKPTNSFAGIYVRYGLSANKILNKTVVELLKIEPDHNVLEVGFGPGHGIQYVFEIGHRNGKGKIYGVDFSTAMCDHVKRRFREDIKSGKLTILCEDVAKTSLPNDHFDKVFHTNSYFYWPDLDGACKELYRTMKNGSDMATVIHSDRIMKVTGRLGVLKYAVNMNSEGYAKSLKKCGFVNIKMKNIKTNKANLLGIQCRKP